MLDSIKTSLGLVSLTSEQQAEMMTDSTRPVWPKHQLLVEYVASGNGGGTHATGSLPGPHEREFRVAVSGVDEQDPIMRLSY